MSIQFRRLSSGRAPLFIVVESVGRRLALTPALSPKERERDDRPLPGPVVRRD